MNVRGLTVKFVNVCEWFHGCDRLKIILKSKQNKITKLYFILKIIQYYHYISLIYRRKNYANVPMKVTYFNKKYLKDNLVNNFIIKYSFLNLIW